MLTPPHHGARPEIVSVQYLRGFAALAVTYEHVFWNRLAGDLGGAGSGLWGVDIFFAISGFVMWFVTSGRPVQPAVFMFRRCCRILPLYWIALTVWIGSRLLIPDRYGNLDVTLGTTILSYFLVPHYHLILKDQVYPILTQGWTLQFEFLFYIVFSVCLFIEGLRPRVTVLTLMLIALVTAGGVYQGRDPRVLSYTSPLLIEFLAGVWIAFHYDRLREMPLAAAVSLFAAGVLALLSVRQTDFPTMHRLLTMGVPAILILLGAIMAERHLARRPSPALLLLGKISFSLYLFHSIAIAMLAVVWHRISPAPPSSYGSILFLIAALATSVAVATAVYVYVERPITAFWSRARLRPASATGTG